MSNAEKEVKTIIEMTKRAVDELDTDTLMGNLGQYLADVDKGILSIDVALIVMEYFREVIFEVERSYQEKRLDDDSQEMVKDEVFLQKDLNGR